MMGPLPLLVAVCGAVLSLSSLVVASSSKQKCLRTFYVVNELPTKCLKDTHPN